jgi:mannitol/fructose-specific phosphotransferase system IIA component (Ntr-type)
VVVARITRPLNNVSQLALLIPPMVERHPGFRRGLAYLGNFASQTGARLTVYAQKPYGEATIAAMGGVRARIHAQVVEVDSWKSFSQALGPQASTGMAVFIFSARPGEAAWHPAVEKMPYRLSEEEPDRPLFLFYLPEGTQNAEAAAPKPAIGEGDLFERALTAGRVRSRMEEAAINDAVRELLRCHYDGDRKTLAKMTALFTEIAQKQPIELEPGVLLLHAHVEEAAEPLLFFGARAEGIRLLSLEVPARLVILLCAPATQSPEEHMRTLGEIVKLVKDGRVAERIGLKG